jgi:hypothetical protein
LGTSVLLVHIHQRKEIENYLLDPLPLARAIRNAVSERSPEEGATIDESAVREMLVTLTDPLRESVLSQILARKTEYLRSVGSKLDAASINEIVFREFETDWKSLDRRIEIVPGKDVLGSLREKLQERFAVSLSDYKIVDSFHRSEIQPDLAELFDELDTFRST